MIRHANARVERQDHKVKEFYQPATELRLSSYITDSLNPLKKFYQPATKLRLSSCITDSLHSVKCRMKLCFMNYALACITSTMFNSYAVLAMYSGARNLHVGVVLFNLCKSLFSFYVNPPMSMHKRSSSHPVKHRKKCCHRDVTDFEK